MSERPKRFRVAFSFAGEKRDFVRRVAAILVRCFGEEAILYDKYHEAEFAVPDLGLYLPRLYHDESDLVVVVICRDYTQKEWCGLEWDAIFDLLKKRKKQDVMLCHFDHATVEGLYSTAGFVNLDGTKPGHAAGLILQRLALNEGKAKDYYIHLATNAKGDAPRPLAKQPGDGRDKGGIGAAAPGVDVPQPSVKTAGKEREKRRLDGVAPSQTAPGAPPVVHDRPATEGLTKLASGIAGQESDSVVRNEHRPLRIACWEFVHKNRLLVTIAALAIATLTIGGVIAVRYRPQAAVTPPNQTKRDGQSTPDTSQMGRSDAPVPQANGQSDRPGAAPAESVRPLLPARAPSTAMTVQITVTPPGAQGGPNDMYDIAGVTSGADPAGFRVVVYAYAADRWWIQPRTDDRWTEIAKDGTWSTRTHAGVRYAALLVRGETILPSETGKLPELGGDVLARDEKESPLH